MMLLRFSSQFPVMANVLACSDACTSVGKETHNQNSPTEATIIPENTFQYFILDISYLWGWQSEGHIRYL